MCACEIWGWIFISFHIHDKCDHRTGYSTLLMPQFPCLGSLSGLAVSVSSTEEAWIIFIQCSMETSVVFFNSGYCSCTQVFFAVAVLGPCSISSLYACVCFTWLERPQRHLQANSKNTHACHVQCHGLSPNQSASCTSWLGFLCFCLWISVRGDRFPVGVLLLTCPFLSSKKSQECKIQVSERRRRTVHTWLSWRWLVEGIGEQARDWQEWESGEERVWTLFTGKRTSQPCWK